jgi:transcriptional regulator with XRE-family HTH domain
MGWTQQALADRLAISRVAVSHIEADISLPGERTITLLAGVFKTPPHELVYGTTYPQAKVDRLPRMVCSFTLFEMEMALFENDMAWVERLREVSKHKQFIEQMRQKWTQRLGVWEREVLDEGQQKVLEAVRSKIKEISKS